MELGLQGLCLQAEELNYILSEDTGKPMEGRERCFQLPGESWIGGSRKEGPEARKEDRVWPRGGKEGGIEDKAQHTHVGTGLP